MKTFDQTRSELLFVDLILGTVAESDRNRTWFVPEGPMFMALQANGMEIDSFKWATTIAAFKSAGLLETGPAAHTLRATAKGRALAAKVASILKGVQA